MQNIPAQLSQGEIFSIKDFINRDKPHPISDFIKEKRAFRTKPTIKEFISRPSTTIKKYIETSPSAGEINRFIRASTETKPTALQAFISGKTERKTTVETVANIAQQSNLSEGTRARLMIRRTIGTEASSFMHRNLTNWMWANWRQIMWKVGMTTALAIGVTISYILLTAGSWMLFLSMLKYIGITLVPTALIEALKRTGVSVATGASIDAVIGMAKKNVVFRRVLQTRVPTSYLGPVLERLGVNPRNVTTEQIAKYSIQQGISLTTYGISGFLISSGLSVGMKGVAITARKTGAAAIAIKNTTLKLLVKLPKKRVRSPP